MFFGNKTAVGECFVSAAAKKSSVLAECAFADMHFHWYFGNVMDCWLL